MAEVQRGGGRGRWKIFIHSERNCYLTRCPVIVFPIVDFKGRFSIIPDGTTWIERVMAVRLMG